MPALLDIVARHREGQPLGCVSMGRLTAEHAPGWFGAPGTSNGLLMSMIDKAQRSELGVLARTLHGQSERLARQAGGQLGPLTTTAENIGQAADLFERMQSVPAFQPAVWSTEAAQQDVATLLQRVLWLLEHDLTKSAFLKLKRLGLATLGNSLVQSTTTTTFLPMFVRFLREMEQRSTSFGTLMDTTQIIVTSELGRFPRLNSDEGKDHFPQAPCMFIGGSVNAHNGSSAAFGATGREMEALPIRLKDGHPAAGRDGDLVHLDDIGSTVLHLAGLDPRRFGYDGRVALEFLT